MTREELQRNYWRYYSMLESKLINTFSYVEVNRNNFSTYSNEYAMLLQAIGAEIDNFFKVYCGFNLTERKNISDYADFVLPDWSGIINQKIKVLGTDIELTPFEQWNTSAPAQSLPWWQAFDNIKHNRQGNMADAKLENALNILAALYILEMKMFGKVAVEGTDGHLEEPDSPDEESKLFTLENWNFRYIRVGKFFAVIDGAIYQTGDD